MKNRHMFTLASVAMLTSSLVTVSKVSQIF